MNDGGPAFPNSVAVATNANHEPMVWDSQDRALPGMSLRDWFAGQAMIGYIADCKHPDNATPSMVAEWSYANADAMLEARTKEQP